MDKQQGRLARAVDLYWIPLGAGGYVVRLSGKLYEALKALVEHRPRLDLYHSALQIWLPDDRFVIECAAILNLRGEERGVVAGGPVGMSWLGRFRHFRYEIRRWLGGSIPDLSQAVLGPVRVARTSFAPSAFSIWRPPSRHPCGVGTSCEPGRCGTQTR